MIPSFTYLSREMADERAAVLMREIGENLFSRHTDRLLAGLPGLLEINAKAKQGMDNLLFNGHPGIEIKLEKQSLIVGEHFKADLVKNIYSAFLSPGGSFGYVSPTVLSEYTIARLCYHVLGITVTPKNVIENKLPSGAKLSRAVLRGLQKVEQNTIFTLMDQTSWAGIGDENGVEFRCTRETIFQDVERFFQTFYNDCKSKDCSLYISSHLADFLTLSDGERKYTSWSSCVRPDGEYATSLNSYLRDGHTLVSYIAPSGSPFSIEKKIGRSLVYFHPHNFHSSRIYGTMGPDVIKQLHLVLRSIVGGEYCEEIGEGPFDYSQEGATPYIDDITYSSYVDDGMAYKFSFVNPICPICHENISTGEQYDDDGFICHECNSRRPCVVCGEEHSDCSSILLDGELQWVCESCSDDLIRCPGCGEFFTSLSRHVLGVGGRCETCYVGLVRRGLVRICPTCGEGYHIARFESCPSCDGGEEDADVAV